MQKGMAEDARRQGRVRLAAVKRQAAPFPAPWLVFVFFGVLEIGIYLNICILPLIFTKA